MNFKQMARDVIAEWANGDDGTPRGFREHLVTAFRRVADAEAEAIQRICTDQAGRKTSDFMAEYDDVAIGFQDGARICAAKIAARRKNRSAT